MEFESYLIDQVKRHPAAGAQDIVKLCYQAAYGAEHLLLDMATAENALREELTAVPTRDGAMYEPISDHICRVNLAAWKAKQLPAEWLTRMFFASAQSGGGDERLFEEYLRAAERLCGEESVGVSKQDWDAYLSEYRARGMGPVHHSAEYRAAESPAYRVVNRCYCRAIPVLLKAAAHTKDDGCCVIAIDGRAASGKTTLANMLAQITGAALIRMDDFFLPPALRTQERLAEAGGNIHYERFMEEVIPKIANREPFSYAVFDCGQMRLRGEKEVGGAPIRIVEGSYSCHPYFGSYADVKVFLDMPYEQQLARIRKRNGAELLEAFRDKWIPMEEQYFVRYAVAEMADIQL